ncbi:hypothetical protein Tco_0356066 [Tanacetum coccineum]
MNLATKHETIPNPRFTKLIIRHLLSHNPNLNKRLDSPPHLVSDEARLEKLKYVVMGEPRHTSTLGMSIHEVMMTGEIKESQAYVNYLTKYPHAQSSSSTPKHGMGKGLMRRGDVPTPKKKKDVIPIRQRTIIFADNVFPDLDEALEYAKMVNKEEIHPVLVLLKLSEYVQPRLERTKIHSFLAHEKHLELYNALMNSMGFDESTAKGDDVEEPRQNEETEHEVQTEEVLEPDEHEFKNGSVVIFGKLVKKIFKKDKITKEDMEGPFELLKGTCKNIIKLEYNMEQCHLALIYKIDWTNPESDRFHHDLSKPLPLTGPPGRKRIPVSYFFNHDLEESMEQKKNTYILSVTNIKAARYEDEGIEEMIPHLWSLSNIGLKSQHEVYSKIDSRSVQSFKGNKKYGYTYQEEIVVKRIDEKEYKFAEADFQNLNQNDIEDLFLLKI